MTFVAPVLNVGLTGWAGSLVTSLTPAGCSAIKTTGPKMSNYFFATTFLLVLVALFHCQEIEDDLSSSSDCPSHDPNLPPVKVPEDSREYFKTERGSLFYYSRGTCRR